MPPDFVVDPTAKEPVRGSRTSVGGYAGCGFFRGLWLCGFFLQNFRRFYKLYPTLFGEADAEEGEAEVADFTDGFNENYGWLYNTKRVADLKGIPLDAAFEIQLIEFFNWLVYIKEKDQHDQKMSKHAREPK